MRLSKKREKLAELKKNADFVIDTTNFKQNDLRERLMEICSDSCGKKIFDIKVVSFGFKNGLPLDADMVYDVRCFPNPFYVPELKNKTGNYKEVRDYVMDNDIAREFFGKLCDMIEFVVPVFEAEGRYSLIIAIGCTGGHHRSVTFANALAEHLSLKGYNAVPVHRDIDN